MSIETSIKSLGDLSKSIVIGLAIMILTMFVSVYGINTLYDNPEYEDFCKNIEIRGIYETHEACEASGGRWVIIPVAKPLIDEESLNGGYCDIEYNCRQEYESARKIYSRNAFLTAIPLGIFIIALGTFIFSLNSVGVGLMLGGVGTFIYGAGSYWRYTENWLRFSISLAGLVALIWLAYWFNRRFEKPEKKEVKKRK